MKGLARATRIAIDVCVVFGAPRVVGVRVDSGMRNQAMFRTCISRLHVVGEEHPQRRSVFNPASMNERIVTRHKNIN